MSCPRPINQPLSLHFVDNTLYFPYVHLLTRLDDGLTFSAEDQRQHTTATPLSKEGGSQRQRDGRTSPEPQPCAEMRGRSETFTSLSVFICFHLRGAERQTWGDETICCFPAAAFLTMRLLSVRLVVSRPLCLCEWEGWSNGKARSSVWCSGGRRSMVSASPLSYRSVCISAPKEWVL